MSMVTDIHFTARLRGEGGWFVMVGGVRSAAGIFFFFFDMLVYLIIRWRTSFRTDAAESIAHGPFIFLQLIDNHIIVLKADNRLAISICLSRRYGRQALSSPGF